MTNAALMSVLRFDFVLSYFGSNHTLMAVLR